MFINQILAKLKSLVYSKSETDSLLNGKASNSHTHTKSQITDFPAYGNTADTICQGNDSRLSDARTPTSHTHTKSQITDFPTIPTVNNATLTIQKNGTTVKTFTANASSNVTCNITVPTKTSELTNNSGFLTSHQSLSGYVPRSGGNVMTGSSLGRNVNTDRFDIYGGAGWNNGGMVILTGASYSDAPGVVKFTPCRNSSTYRDMWLNPNGTWTWSGTACQIGSDQRLKQQISNIDDKLLDAWEDVLPCQFKYNDAVSEKGDTARLHTGYVVQQIDEACQKHNIDISEYGLYCHEEYPEETEEVEVEQKDGTKTKEKKVIREANEHYSLRYTEVYAVECMYLRRENSRLKENLASIEERLEKLEKAENS